MAASFFSGSTGTFFFYFFFREHLEDTLWLRDHGRLLNFSEEDTKDMGREEKQDVKMEWKQKRSRVTGMNFTHLVHFTCSEMFYIPFMYAVLSF